MTREVYLREGPHAKHVVPMHLIDGLWYAKPPRKLLPHESPDDFPKMTSPNEQEAPVLGKSGSSNTHARLSPSDAERWSNCTAAVSAEQAAADKILVLDFDNVRKLIPYLETFPDELHDHEKRAIQIVKDVQAGKLKLKKLTPEQRRDIKRSEGNVASREGTRAHDFAEAVATGRRTLESVPEEFRQHVGDYIRYCRMINPDGAEVFWEHKVPLYYHPEEEGTLDHGFVTDERVVIVDLKYGAGKLVKMTDNRQLAIYALSLVKEADASGMYFFEPDTMVEIHVFQPRHHEAALLKPWILTLADLESFCQAIGDKAAHIMKGEGLVFAPSYETCYWCKVRRVGCEAYSKFATQGIDRPDHGLTAMELLDGLPDDDDLAELDGVNPAVIKKRDATEKLTDRLEYATNGKISLLDDETLIMLMTQAKAINNLIDDATAHLSARVLSGEKIPGLKIVMGREGNRKWANEAATKAFCVNQKLTLDEYMPRVLAGPAVIEKIPALAAKLDEKTGLARTRTRFAELVSRSGAQKVVTLASDDRPEVNSDIDDLPDDPDPDDVIEEDEVDACG